MNRQPKARERSFEGLAHRDPCSQDTSLGPEIHSPVGAMLASRVPSMTSTGGFRVAAQLALSTTLLLFALIVIGSVVRTTGSGLACPDWPLCEGRIIPRLEPHVLIEWFHRLIALLVSIMVLGTAGWIGRMAELRGRLGGLALLAVGLLVAQVLLGALTVWKLLSPAVVNSHLAVALLLFATLLTITLVARGAAEDRQASGRDAALLPFSGLATGLAYLQCLLGGLVSSTGSGLACPDWPTCNGRWFPPLAGAVGIQMMHRYGAYLLTAVVVVTAARARAAADPGVRAAAGMAAALTLLQVALGVASVLLGTPPWASALHLANAVVLLAMLLATSLRAAPLPEGSARPAADPAIS